ncbi:MAG: hypothetical protein ACRDSF_25540, partial [Pseudonocardiaceae bacterium]
MEEASGKCCITSRRTRFGSLVGQTADQPIEVSGVGKESVGEAELGVEELITSAGGDDEVVL